MVVHISRQPESILHHDGDVIALIPDRIVANLTNMSLYNREGGDLICQTTEPPVLGDRILLFGRNLPDESLAGGIRSCVYQSNGEANVLREVISPRVSYDSNSNVITMWFWTNFEVTPPEEYDDSEGVLYRIDESDFDSGKEAWRALCCATGSVNRYYIEGGLLPETGGTESDYDYVPLFNTPKILTVLKQPIDGVSDGVPIIDFAGTGGGSDSFEITPVKDVTYRGEHPLEALTSFWQRYDHPDFYSSGSNEKYAYKTTIVTGVSYQTSSNNTIDVFNVDLYFDTEGKLIEVSEERRTSIAILGECP